MTIHKGLKYQSAHFSATAQVYEIREGEVDIMYTSSDGTAWIEKGFSLQQLIDGFKNGSYWVMPLDLVNISIF